MSADRQIPTSLSTPPVNGGAALDDIQLELTTLYNSVALPLSNIGGTANAVTADVTPAMLAGLVDNMSFWFQPASTNTAAMTMAIGGTAAKSVVDSSGVAVRAGMLRASGKYLLHYDASLDVYIAANANQSIGKQSIFIRADQMVSRTTNGAANGTVETTTNKVMLATKDFDASTEEYVQFHMLAPKRWNEGTMTAKFIWKHAATTVNFGVVWGIQAVALSDAENLDTAFGVAVTVADTGGNTSFNYTTAESSAFTVGSTPAEGDWLVFQVYRKAADGADTLAIDAGLLGVMLYFTTDASNEA